MTRLTPLLLILLRLAIGWHFLFEGVEKLHSDSWSSEAYLREASGPLAPAYHWMAGDTLAERLTPKPLPADADPTRVPAHDRLPPALAADLQGWFDRFVAHYGLSEQQRQEAEGRFLQHQDKIGNWIVSGTDTVTLSSPHGPPASREMTVRERIEAYRQKLDQARVVESEELPAASGSAFEADAAARLRDLKADANRLRSGLTRDLDNRVKAMQDSLRELLTAEQARQAPLSDDLRGPVWQRDLLGQIDFLIPWALTVVGGCLLVGLFTRTSCVAGAILLLSFYLAMPPWPGVAPNPRVEGHYFIVNKNLIEMLALLALATTYSGRWAGLDGLLRFLNPFNYRRRETAVRKEEARVPA